MGGQARTRRSLPIQRRRRPLTGEKVVDSHESEVFKLIKQNYGDAYAVAMEEFGFAAAAQTHSTVTFAVVRGISDAAQDKAQVEEGNSQGVGGTNSPRSLSPCWASATRPMSRHLPISVSGHSLSAVVSYAQVGSSRQAFLDNVPIWIWISMS